MSRKRSLKKQEKRREDACARVAALCRRGAHDDALALAAREWKDPGASPAAGPWAEAADAALGSALRRAEYPRLRRLLPLARSASAPRPLAALAGAVLDLQAGRLGAARAALDELAAGPAAGELPAELLEALGELSRESPLEPESEELAPVAALWRALRELEAAGHEAAATDLRALADRVEAVRAGPAGAAAEEPARSLLDLCRGRLALAADLAALDGELAGEAGRAAEPPSERLLGWLRGVRDRGQRLAATLAEVGPPLAEPLRHLVYRRWRALLERVVAAESAHGLGVLAARDPRLVADEVWQAGGSPADLGALAERTRARELLAQGRFEDLRRLLRKRSRLERDAGELAALWGLELRTWSLEDAQEDEDGYGDPPPSSNAHSALVRLGEMAGEIERRFPREQRVEVALALRDELFRLCEALQFCGHFGAAALALLGHADTDPGLLLIAATAAVVTRDRRELQQVEQRLERQRPLRDSEREVAVRIMGQVACEEPEDVAEVLELVRPLFGDEVWPPVRDRMARELVPMVAGGLEAAAAWYSEDEADEADEVLRRLREDVEALRPALGSARAFAAAELALRCWEGEPGAADDGVDAYLAAWPGWEGALLPVRALDGAPYGEPRTGLGAARRRLANAAVDRLDDRWPLWLPELTTLALASDPTHQRKVVATLKRLRKSPDLPPEDREALGDAVRALEGARNLLKVLEAGRRFADEAGARTGPSGGRPAGRRRRKPGRRDEDEDRQLDLGWLD